MRHAVLHQLNRQKAWKPDCGIETHIPICREMLRSQVRRPGSPIAGLKLFQTWACWVLLKGVRRPGSPIAGLKLYLSSMAQKHRSSQKAWKPDCGIETA